MASEVRPAPADKGADRISFQNWRYDNDIAFAWKTLLQFKAGSIWQEQRI